MPQDILITPRTGDPQILFRGSGIRDTSINLNVLSSYQSASTSGTALLFEGTEGQLFAITDNLSSGVIFSVGDVTGLPLFEIDSSGVMYLSEFGSNIRAYRALELYPSGTATNQTNELRYYELASNGSNYVGFKAPNSIASNVIWTLPSGDGSSGQVLQTNGAGVLSFVAQSGGAGGGITGLTTNYIPKATSATGIANSQIFDDGSVVGINNASPGARLHINAGSNTTKVLIARGAASQTANLTEWQNSAGTILTSIDPTGNIRFDAANLASNLSGVLYLNTDRKIANASNIRYKADVASPGLVFTPSGTLTPSVTLNLLTDATNSVSGVATLSFEGSAGQLFSITDQLASGTIFSVNDIGGLPLIEADASGLVHLGRYGEDVRVYKNLNIQNTYSIKENILGNTSGNITINLASGNYVIATSTGATTWSVSGIPNNEAVGFILQLGSGGLYTQTWPSGCRWPGGNAPVLTASGVDVLTFITTDFGSSFRAVLSMHDSK